MRDSCQALEKQLEKRHTYVTQSDLQSFNAASEAGEIFHLFNPIEWGGLET